MMLRRQQGVKGAIDLKGARLMRGLQLLQHAHVVDNVVHARSASTVARHIPREVRFWCSTQDPSSRSFLLSRLSLSDGYHTITHFSIVRI